MAAIVHTAFHTFLRLSFECLFAKESWINSN